MAAASTLTKWLLANAEQLDLRATKLEWVNDWLPGLHDFAVELRVGGHLFEGRGTADTEELAFAKAAGEALERVVVASTDAASSNGFALHPSPDQAAALAKAELIERDAYFCHWFTRTPFLDLSISQHGAMGVGGTNLAAIIDRLEGIGIDLKVARMKTADDSVAVACVARGTRSGKPFGVIQGFGCSGSLHDSICKAAIECLRTVVAWQSGNYQGGEPLGRFEFADVPHPGPLEHERLGLSLCSADLLDLYVGCNTPLRDGVRVPVHIRFDQIPLPAPISDAPIAVARATSRDLQDAVFGRLKPAKLNLDRLSNFCGRRVEIADVRFDPHCFG